MADSTITQKFLHQLPLSTSNIDFYIFLLVTFEIILITIDLGHAHGKWKNIKLRNTHYDKLKTVDQLNSREML